MAKKAKRATSRRQAPRKAARRARTRYSDQERQRILAAAKERGLTALQVKKEFGVTPVTYYSWRKKGLGTPRRRRAAAVGAATGRALAGAANMADLVRDELRQMIRRMIPEVIASELGTGGRRRGRKRS